jgi:hypothetical protein
MRSTIHQLRGPVVADLLVGFGAEALARVHRAEGAAIMGAANGDCSKMLSVSFGGRSARPSKYATKRLPQSAKESSNWLARSHLTAPVEPAEEERDHAWGKGLPTHRNEALGALSGLAFSFPLD